MSHPSSQQAPRAKASLRTSLVWAAWVLFGHFLCVVMLFAVLGKTVPKFVRIFEEFGAALPGMTQFVIRLSQAVVSYWYLLLPLWLGIDAAVLLGLSFLPGKAKWLGTLWASLVFIAVTLLLGLAIVAVFVPLVALIRSLS